MCPIYKIVFQFWNKMLKVSIFGRAHTSKYCLMKTRWDLFFFILWVDLSTVLRHCLVGLYGSSFESLAQVQSTFKPEYVNKRKVLHVQKRTFQQASMGKQRPDFFEIKRNFFPSYFHILNRFSNKSDFANFWSIFIESD